MHMAGLAEERGGTSWGQGRHGAESGQDRTISATLQRNGHAGRHIVPHGHGSGAHAFPGRLAQQEIPGRISSYRHDQTHAQPSRAAARSRIR